MMQYDVIGGKADKAKFQCDRKLPVQIDMMGDNYVAIEFPVQADTKQPTVTVFILAGTKPIDAIEEWRKRQ